jgi:hypothetical protein
MVSMAFATLDEKGKVNLKVTKEENGQLQVFEKQYNSMDELKADEELKQFDVLVEEWANENNSHFTFSSGDKKDGEKTIIIKKKIGDNDEMTWIADDMEEMAEKEHKMVFKSKDGQVEKNVIRIKTDDGDEEFTMKLEGDGEHKMVWIDESGNKTELTQENIEKMISEDDANELTKTHKKIEIITSDDDDGNVEVIVSDGKNDHTIEVEAEVSKEVDENGVEKIIDKKVWVTKDGEKVALDDDDNYEFKSDGNTFTIKVEKESVESADFSGGKFEGDKVMVFRNKVDGDPGTKLTMNINIDEKDGEKFIEIEIKRNKSANVTISELQKEDSSLKDINYSLKNNLKPSQLNYYPNPNTGRFTLNFVLDQKDEVTVAVMDILGKEVYKEKLLDFQGTYDNQIDLSGKEKGIYILQISQKKKTLTRKILIE